MFPPADLELPAVDERLVAPGSRFEIEDGNVIELPYAEEDEGVALAGLAAVLGAYRAPGYSVALRMLTRTSHVDDFAPAASVYPKQRDLVTGGRQIEELAFELATGDALVRAGTRAVKLMRRGVRRVFCLDVGARRVLEWSAAAQAWSELDHTSTIDDPAFVTALPVWGLTSSKGVDAAMLYAYSVQGRL